MRSLTTVSLSSCSGMPLASSVRGPLKLRVSTTSVSKRPSPSVSSHLADRIAHEARLFVLGEIAAVRVDPAWHEDFEIHVGDLWQDDELDGLSSPWPPAAWSARLATSRVRYSGVSGACWPRPGGLVWSHWLPTFGKAAPRG